MLDELRASPLWEVMHKQVKVAEDAQGALHDLDCIYADTGTDQAYEETMDLVEVQSRWWAKCCSGDNEPGFSDRPESLGIAEALELSQLLSVAQVLEAGIFSSRVLNDIDNMVADTTLEAANGNERAKLVVREAERLKDKGFRALEEWTRSERAASFLDLTASAFLTDSKAAERLTVVDGVLTSLLSGDEMIEHYLSYGFTEDLRSVHATRPRPQGWLLVKATNRDGRVAPSDLVEDALKPFKMAAGTYRVPAGLEPLVAHEGHLYSISVVSLEESDTFSIAKTAAVILEQNTLNVHEALEAARNLEAD